MTQLSLIEEIKTLRRERDELADLLRPFAAYITASDAACAARIGVVSPHNNIVVSHGLICVLTSDFRAAAAKLAELDAQPPSVVNSTSGA